MVDQRQLYRCDRVKPTAGQRESSSSRNLSSESIAMYFLAYRKYGWPAGEAIKEALSKIEID